MWFHDAVGKPFAVGNERKSAAWRSSFLAANGANEKTTTRVHRLKVVTDPNALTLTKEESILVDLDLAILDSDPATEEILEHGVQ